jgi:AraC-like DNA-binding protein
MTAIKKKEGFYGQRSIVIPHRIVSQQCEAAPVVRDLYITAIGYYPNAQYHYRQRLQGVNEHILLYCVAGKGMVKIQSQDYEVSPGSLVLIPANLPHEYGADESTPWTIYWVHFKGSNSFDFVNMMLDKLNGYMSFIPFHENRIQLFDDLYTSLERGYSRNNISYASLGLQYFLSSCCFFENYLPKPKEQHDSVDACITFMQQHIDEMLTLQEIAKAANLSESHCAAIFKKKTGYSMIEYFNQLKIQKACQYLQFTDLRVNEIANKLGIEDPFYFSRMFNKISGISPLKYRAKYHVTS